MAFVRLRLASILIGRTAPRAVTGAVVALAGVRTVALDQRDAPVGGLGTLAQRGGAVLPRLLPGLVPPLPPRDCGLGVRRAPVPPPYPAMAPWLTGIHAMN